MNFKKQHILRAKSFYKYPEFNLPQTFWRFKYSNSTISLLLKQRKKYIQIQTYYTHGKMATAHAPFGNPLFSCAKLLVS